MPVLVKGIATPDAARLALQHGADGIIVSNYGGLVGPGTDAPILALPQIVDAVDGKVPVLVDGSFRRGTDILKALAFGAQGVLVGRPVMWGLAAYGADGVQGVVEMLQTELARYMGMCGKSHVGMLDRTILRVHGGCRSRRRWRRERSERGVDRRRFEEAAVGRLETRWRQSMSRRKAIAGLAGALAGSPLFRSRLSAQMDPRPLKDHKRLPGLDEMMTAFDFEPVMFANVPLAIYDYTAHGDGSEFTVRRNRQAFDWVDLVPGRAVDPKSVDLSTEMLGTRMKYPIMVAPSAVQVPLHPDGEIGMHRGATAASNTPMILSQITSTSVDKVAAAATGPLWSQFYPQQDRAAGRKILERGAGRRLHRGRGHRRSAGVVLRAHRAESEPRRQPAAGPAAAAPRRLPASWPGRVCIACPPGGSGTRGSTSTRFAQIVKVPMLVKGILTAEDARLCLEHGMDGVIVSNHGGRSMDYGPSTLEVLPEIVAAVNGRVPVITDSGYRRGADILKALALGADAVLLGRTHAVGAWRLWRAGRAAAAGDRAAGTGRGRGGRRTRHAGVDRHEHREDAFPVRPRYVADAPGRQDQLRSVRVALDLTPDAADNRVHRPFRDGRTATPDLRQERRAAEYDARPRGHEIKQVEFVFRHLDRCAPDEHLTPVGVQLDVA